MIQTGKRYEQLTKAHEEESYRKDTAWLLEVETLSESHLVKAVEIPSLACYGGMLVPADGEALSIVLRLPTNSGLEAKIGKQIVDRTHCKAALYMLGPEKGESGDMKVVSTWVFDGFEISKMKLQGFDRDHKSSTVELLLTCTFKEVRIV
jgi:hypothetical protein